MKRPVEGINLLRRAAAYFSHFTENWPRDMVSEGELTRNDADTVLGHVDRIFLFSGPGIPPIVPEDDQAVEAAFIAFAAFVAGWPADRVDPASQLTRADLDLIVSTQGSAFQLPVPPCEE